MQNEEQNETSDPQVRFPRTRLFCPVVVQRLSVATLSMSPQRTQTQGRARNEEQVSGTHPSSLTGSVERPTVGP